MKKAQATFLCLLLMALGTVCIGKLLADSGIDASYKMWWQFPLSFWSVAAMATGMWGIFYTWLDR